jgi:hypothetical protein
MKIPAPQPLRIAFAIVLLATTISLCYGLQYRIAAGQVFIYYLAFSAVFAIILAFLTYNLFRGTSAPLRLGEVHGWCGFILMLASFTLTLFFNSNLLAPVPWYLLSAAAALLGCYLHWRWSARASTRFFAFVALAFVALVIAKTESFQKGDMLATAEASGREFLAGKQPYRPYPDLYVHLASKLHVEVQDLINHANRLQVAHRPIYHLPGVWLAYLPAVALGLDLRVLNLLYLACLILIFERLLPIRHDRSIALSLTFYPFLLSPSFLGIVSALHVLHYWLFLLLTMLFIQEKRYWFACLSFGLALATRQPALFLVVPLFAWLSLQLRWKELLRYGLATFGVYLTVMLPFAIWYGDVGMFWKHHYFDVASLQDTGDFRRDIGLANLLDLAGLAWSGVVIQLAIILFATVYIIVRKREDLSWTQQFLGMTYIWLIFFNTYSVRYVYYSGFLLVLAGVAIALGQISKPEWDGEIACEMTTVRLAPSRLEGQRRLPAVLVERGARRLRLFWTRMSGLIMSRKRSTKY